VAHLTNNFTSEGPLSLGVREAISAALEQGWSDPKKLSQASHRAQALRTQSIEEMAQILQLSPAAIEVTGEPHLLHLLALKGYLDTDRHLYTSTIDVGKIRAIARAHTGPTSQMEVDNRGAISMPSEISLDSVVSLQAENGETGIHQNLDMWRSLPAQVVLDATHTVPDSKLTEGFACATFDAQSWNGPSGLGFLVINDGDHYRYPLAHIAPIRVPGSYSLPLLVGAVIALNEYREKKEQIDSVRNLLAEQLRTVDGLTVIGEENQSSRYLSAIVEGVSGEEVLRALLKIGIATDSGSACSPEDLAPSHVIGAMGFPTTGHLRFTIHPETLPEETENLVEKVKGTLQTLRS
jgi:cysteine desulfurase